MEAETRQTQQVPGDLALRLEWQAGTMPPPYHYEYTIHLGPGPTGEIVFLPDYAQHHPPTWREGFAVLPTEMARLYALLSECGVFSRQWHRPAAQAVGGDLTQLEVTVGGARFAVPGELARDDARAIEPVYEAIRGLVPAAVWERLQARRAAYEQAYRLEHGPL